MYWVTFYCAILFIAVVWKEILNISEVCLYAIGCVQVICKYNTILYKELDIQGFWFLQKSWNQSPLDTKGWLVRFTCMFFLNHLTVSRRHLVPSSLSISLCYFLRNRDGFLGKQKIVFKSEVLIMIPQSSSQYIQILSIVLVIFFNRSCCLFLSQTKVVYDLQLSRLSVSLTWNTPSAFLWIS